MRIFSSARFCSRSRFCFLMLLVAATAGCQIYALAPAGRITVVSRLSTEPSINWNKRVQDNQEIWTIDGERLQSILFLAPVPDGGKLFSASAESARQNAPEFSADMSLLEIQTFLESSYHQLNFNDYQVLKFEPAKFGGKDGFRIEFSFTIKSGLKKLGIATGAKVDGKLYMVFYHGAKMHYYEQYLKEVEGIFRSISFTSAAS